MKSICFKWIKTSFLFLVLALMGTNVVSGFTISSKAKYIDIDSLNQDHCKRYLALDIKGDELEAKVGDAVLSITQINKLDTVGRWISFQYLPGRFDNGSIQLEIRELLEVTADSIFFSARYRRIDEKTQSVFGRARKLDRVGVSRDQLNGVLITHPTAKEIRRSRRNFSIILGAFTITVTVLSILAGGG